MLVSCSDCGHQYDAGDLEAGSKFLCHCGIYVRVPEVRVKEAVVAHCSSCGGHLPKDADQCGFCGSEVAAVDLNLGQTCPQCYSRMLKGASFCSSCGTSIRPEMLHDGATDHDCPRCKIGLVRRRVAHGAFNECTKCGGMWLGEGFFDNIVQKRDDESIGQAIVAESSLDRSAFRSEANVVKYIPCPVCAELMNRKNFAQISGVIIDWCKDHGYWFDAFELEQVLEFVSSGGLDKSRVRTMERVKRESESAMNRKSAANRAASLPLNNTRQHGIESFDLLDGVISLIGGLFKR